MQSIKFVLTDPGEPSAGIPCLYEEVLVKFEYGGHDPESIKSFSFHMEKLIKDCFGESTSKVQRKINA